MAVRRIPPSAVASWSDAKVTEAWNDLRETIIRIGCKNEGDLPPTYRWNYQVLMTEVALRFAQGRLF